MRAFLTGTRCSLAAIALMTVAMQAVAQDIIVKSDGSKVEAVVREIGPQEIKYKRFDNASGPDYIIQRSKVLRIQYANGSEEIITERLFGPEGKIATSIKREPTNPAAVGNKWRNMVSIMPISMTNTSAQGIGISYERFLVKAPNLSLQGMAVYSFRESADNNGTGYNRGPASVLWFYPGVKLYLDGTDKKVLYAFSATLPVVAGTESTRSGYFNSQGTYVNENRSNNILLLGAMATGYLQVQASPRLMASGHFGLGVPYLKFSERSDEEEWRYYSRNRSFLWVSFGVGIGYRF